MEKEHAVKLAEEVVERYARDKSTQAFAKAESFLRGVTKPANYHELLTTIRDANRWVRWRVEGNEDAYEDNKYHIFSTKQGDVYLAAGREEDTD